MSGRIHRFDTVARTKARRLSAGAWMWVVGYYDETRTRQVARGTARTKAAAQRRIDEVLAS